MELFIFGSLMFWALVAVELAVLCAFVECENGFGATVSLVVFACCLKFFGNVDIILFAKTQPVWLLIVIGLYFLLGVATAAFKWWLYCKDAFRAFCDVRDGWLKKKGVAPGSVLFPLKDEWTKYLKDNHLFGYDNFGGSGDIPPQVRENKTRILRWMGFWPVVVLWSLFRDALVRAWNEIYAATSRWLQRISDKIFSGVRNDLPESRRKGGE